MERGGWVHQTIVFGMIFFGAAGVLYGINQATDAAIEAYGGQLDKQTEITQLYMTIADLEEGDKVFDIVDPGSGARYILIHKGKLVVEGNLDD